MAATKAPPFLSARFHLRFFPSLIWRRLKPRDEAPHSSFANHGSVEYFVALVGAALAVAIGLPAALHGSAIGITAAVLGCLAIAALLSFSVWAARGTYAGFEAFHVWVFFFFPMAAMTVGASFGSFAHSPSQSLLYAAVGLAAGYPLGIGAGLSAQRLGWIAALLDNLAMICLPGLLVMDIALVYL